MRFLAKVYIKPKEAVLDPQGQAVTKALHSLNFADVTDVRVGRYIEVRLEASDPSTAADKVNSYCESLLANPVIESFSFDVQVAS